MYISYIFIIAILLLPTANVFATVVENTVEDKPQEQEECEERGDYPGLCNGINGVTGWPYCDQVNGTKITQIYPNLTHNRCFDREASPINFCATFDDLTNTYEHCRKVPGSQEFYEYLKTGGPDESCLFDAYQIKCQPDPITDECPPDFGNNEDGYCIPQPNGEWDCPEGYHGTDDDESGQCYPNSEGCEYDDYVLLTDRANGQQDMCAYLGYLCNDKDNEESDHPACKEFLEETRTN